MGRKRKRDIRTAQESPSKIQEISFAPETSENFPQETPQETPQDNSNVPTPESEGEFFPRTVKERLSWPINNGKFDVGGFRKETAEQAKEIARQSFLDSDFRKWAGIEQETGPIADALFPPQIAGQALDLIASVETLVMTQKTGLTYDECHRIMKWEPQEHEVLDSQGAKLARKHINARWLEKMDLYMFLGSVAFLSAGKMRMCNEYAAKRLEEIGKSKDTDAGRKIGESVPAPRSNGAFPIVTTPVNEWPKPKTDVEGKSLE
jgi:hypothetical protein